jgi:PD-(D/E)XK nuclease superfamily
MKFWIFNLHPQANEFRNRGKSIGDVVDQALHRFFARNADNRNIESLKADFEMAWVREKENVKDWCILTIEEEECRQDCWVILQAFFQSFDTTSTPIYIPPLKTIPFNERFQTMIELPITESITIRGWGDRLDKISKGYEVIDYKTKSGTELYEERNSLQLRMYGLLFDNWLVRNDHEGKVIKLTFAYLTCRGVELRSFEFTEEDRQSTINEITIINRQLKEHWDKYQQNPWPCTCGSCNNLLKKMETRADEWAKAMQETAAQTTFLKDLPF